MTTATDVVTAAADRLVAAQETSTPCGPVRDLIDDIDAAYAVQDELAARRTASGARVVGRKIGLTSPAVQKQLGVDQPDFGVLFDDMAYTDGDLVSMAELLQPKIEAEVAFILGSDLDGDLDIGVVHRAVRAAAPALEIVDSRISDWDITILDTIADNGSSAAFVLGETRLGLEDIEPRDVTMSLYVDDVEVSSGTGRACLGDPLEALLWLAVTARDHGAPLRAGEVVLSGALGPMVPVTAGQTVRAKISDLGTVAATFVEDRA